MEAIAPATSAGTTSACAENTLLVHLGTPGLRNYLRVRGEYLVDALVALSPMELPPRARRILKDKLFAWNEFGTTSACAENTKGRGRRILQCRNYLRVRGEYRPRPAYQQA